MNLVHEATFLAEARGTGLSGYITIVVCVAPQLLFSVAIESFGE